MVFLLGILGFCFFINVEALAQGNLLITPRRVVFEGSKKSMDLNLANVGNDSATYSISIVQIRMREDGGFETITQPDPDQRFADKYIRFFPRSVTLGPNESQLIKVQLTKANELTPGEYRSHLYFRAVPRPKPLGEKETKKDSSTISIQLTPVFGITIPVIIRNGASTTSVTLSGLAFKTVNDTVPNLSVVFNRSGNMSCFGDLIVDYVSPQGKITRVGSANGIAVYTPNPIRRFQFNLKNVAGVNYKTGNLKVTYSAPSDVKPMKYAEAELTLH
jgi:P pilus assembly chaperone PapD